VIRNTPSDIGRAMAALFGKRGESIGSVLYPFFPNLEDMTYGWS